MPRLAAFGLVIALLVGGVVAVTHVLIRSGVERGALMADAPLLVKSSDGTDIAIWRSGSGPPLVLVHGTTADHTRWSPIALQGSRILEMPGQQHIAMDIIPGAFVEHVWTFCAAGIEHPMSR